MRRGRNEKSVAKRLATLLPDPIAHDPYRKQSIIAYDHKFIFELFA